MTQPAMTPETIRSHMSAAIHALQRAGLTSHAESLDRARTAVAALLAERQGMQRKIDELMLEYCPDEMTPEQIENWGSHQRRCSPEQEAAINKSLGLPPPPKASE